jgi:hypothetical protein
MPGFFDDLPIALAREAEALSALIHALREDRKTVLARHGAADEAALYAAIAAGEVPEHPAYEDYLSAGSLLLAHDAARVTLQQLLAEGGRQ